MLGINSTLPWLLVLPVGSGFDVLGLNFHFIDLIPRSNLPHLRVSLAGTACIHHPAQQVTIHVEIEDEGPEQTEVANKVKITANQVSNNFDTLSPKVNGAPALEAAITTFSMTSFRTSSRLPQDEYYNSISNGTRIYNTRARFEATFRDFKMLEKIMDELMQMPNVGIKDSIWKLQDDTRAELGVKARQMAMLDAISKAQDYTSVIRREVVPAQIKEDRWSIRQSDSTSIMLQSYEHSVNGASVEQLRLVPEDIVVEAEVSVDFLSA